jgi:hypothetical protein
MMKYIQELGQKKLGDTYIWKTRRDLSTKLSLGLTDKNFVSSNRKFNMDTRGVFFFERSTYICVNDNPHHVSMAVCGFSRSGDWLIARIRLKLNERGDIEQKNVIIEKSPPTWWMELGIKPYHILHSLTKHIQYHAERREALMKEAQKMYEQVMMEDRFLLDPKDTM